MLKLFEIKLYPFSPAEFDCKVKNAIDKVLAINPNYPQSLLFKNYRSKANFQDYSNGHIKVLLDGSEIYYEARVIVSERHEYKENQQKIEDLVNSGLSYREILARRDEILSSHQIAAYKMPLFTSVKHYSRDWHIDRAINTDIAGKSNKEIQQSIIKDLNDINTLSFYKNLYFDLSPIENIGDCLDYSKLMEKSKENNNG